MPLTSHYGGAPPNIYGDRPPVRAPYYVPREDELDRQLRQLADPEDVQAAISSLAVAAANRASETNETTS